MDKIDACSNEIKQTDNKNHWTWDLAEEKNLNLQ